MKIVTRARPACGAASCSGPQMYVMLPCPARRPLCPQDDGSRASQKSRDPLKAIWYPKSKSQLPLQLPQGRRAMSRLALCLTAIALLAAPTSSAQLAVLLIIAQGIRPTAIRCGSTAVFASATEVPADSLDCKGTLRLLRHSLDSRATSFRHPATSMPARCGVPDVHFAQSPRPKRPNGGAGGNRTPVHKSYVPRSTYVATVYCSHRSLTRRAGKACSQPGGDSQDTPRTRVPH